MVAKNYEKAVFRELEDTKPEINIVLRLFTCFAFRIYFSLSLFSFDDTLAGKLDHRFVYTLHMTFYMRQSRSLYRYHKQHQLKLLSLSFKTKERCFFSFSSKCSCSEKVLTATKNILSYGQ